MADHTMNSMHYAIRRIAGAFVLISLALGWFVSPYWLLFTAFVGVNLLQSSFTHWCLMETILEKTGLVSNGDAQLSGRGEHAQPQR